MQDGKLVDECVIAPRKWELWLSTKKLKRVSKMEFPLV